MMILNESRRDDLLLPYVELLKSKGIECTTGILKKWLLRHLTENGGLRNLSLASNFYLAGAARYYFNGDLTSNKTLAVFDESNKTTDIWNEDVCKRLNALILILRNSVIDSVGTTFEQPEDFGDLSLPKLLRKYGAKINAELGIVKQQKKKGVEQHQIDTNENVGNGYTFDIIYSFNDATKYEAATKPGSWCITYGQNHFNSYVKRLGIHYVIFRKNGWENVERVKGPEWTPNKPQDEYGCSLIALLQSNKNGEPVYITSRWNHGSGVDNSSCEADHAFTKEEFFQKTGVTDNDLQRIFNIWNTNRTIAKKNGSISKEDRENKLKIMRELKYAQMRINGGENPDSVLITIPPQYANSPDSIDFIKNRKKLTLFGSGKPLKSVIVYQVKLHEENFFVMVDRGRILFETLVSEHDYYGQHSWRKTFDYTDEVNDTGNKCSDFKWIKNAIVVKLKGDKFMIFDLRSREFVNIDGVTKFKYLDKITNHWRIDNPIFYEIKMSNNQMALVNSNTNKPLVLPNGECWFESLKYQGKPSYWGRGVKTNLVTDDVKILVITYDSSALKYFYYDVQGKKFLDIDDNNFVEGGQVFAKGINGLDGVFVFGSDSYMISAKSCVLVTRDNKMVSIGGFNTFRSVDSNGKFLFLTQKDSGRSYSDENTFIWSIEDRSFIYGLDGKPLTVVPNSVHTPENLENLMLLRRGWDDSYSYRSCERQKYSIYDVTTKSLLINPSNNSDIFKGVKVVWPPKGENEEPLIKTFKDSVSQDNIIREELVGEYSYEYLINNGYFKKAIIENSTPLEYEDKSNNTQNISYSPEDIETMVRESVNKILNMI